MVRAEPVHRTLMGPTGKWPERTKTYIPFWRQMTSALVAYDLLRDAPAQVSPRPADAFGMAEMSAMGDLPDPPVLSMLEFLKPFQHNTMSGWIAGTDLRPRLSRGWSDAEWIYAIIWYEREVVALIEHPNARLFAAEFWSHHADLNWLRHHFITTTRV